MVLASCGKRKTFTTTTFYSFFRKKIFMFEIPIRRKTLKVSPANNILNCPAMRKDIIIIPAII